MEKNNQEEMTNWIVNIVQKLLMEIRVPSLSKSKNSSEIHIPKCILKSI